MDPLFSQYKNIGIPYYQKIYFDRFKKYSEFENNAYMTTVSKLMPSSYEFINFIIPHIKSKNKLYVTYTMNRDVNVSIYDCDKIVYKDNAILEFQKKFDTYIYFHKGYMDPHPRMFHECEFYKKEFVYINLENIKDGGYFRHQDVLKNGLKNISMKSDDLLLNDVYNQPRKYNVDVAIVHAFLPFINGGLYDAVEYFLAMHDFKPSGYNVKLYLLHNKHDWCNMGEDFILNQIKDKYNLTEDHFCDIVFVKHYKELIKKEVRPTNIVIVDNHTLSCLSYSTRILTKKFFMTVDPYFPSMTDYIKLDAEDKFNIYNEIRMWNDIDD